ncbi:unnamed protein product [Aphis gossypii]|uniref:Transmembrane protein n=1 Tax=Aphis gossypii TaxID=80765 RepID=A0A9P0JJQ4_APHGO|nr:unnamed protein product [Aphis gossypii]
MYSSVSDCCLSSDDCFFFVFFILSLFHNNKNISPSSLASYEFNSRWNPRIQNLIVLFFCFFVFFSILFSIGRRRPPRVFDRQRGSLPRIMFEKKCTRLVNMSRTVLPRCPGKWKLRFSQMFHGTRGVLGANI